MENSMKIEKLKELDSFCVAPWTHVHVIPDGTNIPCCLWDYSVHIDDKQKFGNITDHDTIHSLLNGDEYKKLRRQFVNGERAAGCHRCYTKEQNSSDSEAQPSLRQWMNSHFLDDSIQLQQSIETTANDGTLNTDTPIRYIDIRFGNICNLKCRMCGHHLSSSWYEELIEENKLDSSVTVGKNKFIHVDCYDKIEPLLADVKEIYFAGGEPMLYPEHIKILDRLIEIDNTDCIIRYNTNLTTLKYKNRSLVDLLEKFKHVSIGASIDGMNDTVEYIRTNLVWDDFVKNYDTVKEKLPNVNIFPSSTISILNIETFHEFEKFAIENKWTSNNVSSYGYVTWPSHMDIRYLPRWYKDELIDIYNNHCQWLLHNNIDEHSSNYLKILELINNLNSIDHEASVVNDKMQKLENELNKFDKTAKLDWKSSIPHVYNFLQKHKQKINDSKK